METLSSDLFDWKNGRGHSTLSKLGLKNFPKSFSIRSTRTGVIKTFVINDYVMEANEFFDGEATAYHDGKNQVQIWV